MLKIRDIDSTILNDLNKYVWPMTTHLNSYAICRYDEEIVKDTLTIKIEVPGVKESNLDITLTENSVNIVGTRNKDSISLVYKIPRIFDSATLQASLEDGVLSLTVDRLESSKPRKIEIKSAKILE